MLTKPYEVYVNGLLMRRHLTRGGAERTAGKYPGAKVQIFKIKPSVTIELVYESEGSR